MSLLRHPEYQDSGDPLVGHAPVHWRRSALKHLGSYQNGYPFKPEDWSDEGHPIIRIGQLTGGAEPNYFSGQLPDRVRVRDGDLLFSWSATIDSFIWSGGEAWLNQHIFKVEPTEEATKEFLFYLIKFLAPMLADLDAHGSTMRHIKKESLGQLVFAPPIDEQVAIAAFLDHETAKIDALIAEQEKLIALMAEKRQATISHAVTRGLNPDVPMKDSGVAWLGEVPAHWGVSALSYLASIETGATPDRAESSYWNGEIPWLKTGEINWDPIFEAEEFITDAGIKNSAAKMSKPGTLLMAMYGQGITRGRVALLMIEAAYNQACAAINFGPRISPEFGRYFFMAAYDHVRDAGNETSQMNLSAGLIAKIRLPVPPLEEQLAVIKLLDAKITSLDTVCAESERAINLLKERRSALIAAAVTGQIDVRTFVAEAS